jgi:hypothetical protein
MRIHTTEKLGPKQSMTPGGFLLCRDVAIARTGEQIYHARDFAPNPPPIEPGPDGMILITRDEADVFHPDTIASFEGADIVIGHTFVNPSNVRAQSVGHMQNVRRGTGADSDLLLADFLVKDAEAISLVRGTADSAPLPLGIGDTALGSTADGSLTEDASMLREVSCGYDADYEQISPGRGRQKNIVGNHVALVERGRAGARCAIKDEETKPMKNWKDRALEYLRGAPTQDAEAIAAVEAIDVRTEAEKAQAKTADQVAALTDAVAGLASSVASIQAAITPPTPAPTADSAEVEKARAAVADAMPNAEILVPGFKAPTADSVTTSDDAVALQRSVLTKFRATADGAALLTPMLRGRAIDSLTPDAVAVMFDAAAALQSAKNNAAGFVSPIAKATKDSQSMVATVDNMNQAAKALWAGTL